MKRLFVSLELSSTITQLLQQLDPKLNGVRWLATRQMHLTLSFLGNVSSEIEENLKTHLASISWKGFFLPIVGCGQFPVKGRPKILWIGVRPGHPHLFQLRKRVQEAA